MDRSIKQHVKDLLEKRDYERLVDLCEKDKNYWQEVRFRLYDLDERLQRSSIETVAKIMQRWWSSGKE
ncbi:MAG: hypothetical protein AB1606_05075 [Nitrospirota bacterium]